MTSPYTDTIATLRTEAALVLALAGDVIEWAHVLTASAIRADEALGALRFDELLRGDDSSHDILLTSALSVMDRATNDIEDATAIGFAMRGAADLLEAAGRL